MIFFQEVVYLPDISTYTQTSEINASLDNQYIEHSTITRLQSSDEYSEYREGLSILSKYPIVKSEALILRQNPHDHLQRIVQLVDVSVHGHVVKFANVHFAQNPELAYDHLAELLAILKSRHEKRIITGDFNMPDLKHAQLWQDHYTASTSDYYISFPGNDDRIDFILMPKSDAFVRISVSGDGLSDHHALSAQISIQR
jgi:endonuclease/exonuclease/phosphatase family metal-dependent hydrolase